MTMSAQPQGQPVPAPVTPESVDPTKVADPAAAPPPPEPAKDEPDPRFAAKFAALTKRERAAIQREQALKAREDKIKALESLDKELEDTPEAVLEKRWGKDWYEKLTQRVLKGGTPEEIARRAAREVVESDRKAREENDKKRNTDDEQAKVSAFKGQISDWLEVQGDEFELIKSEPGAVDDLFEAIEIHYNQQDERFRETGDPKDRPRIMSIKEAAEIAEKILEDQYRQKLGKLKKLQPKEEPKVPAEKVATGEVTRTLTNALQTRAATPTKSAVLDIEASKAEAAKLLRWQ